VAGLICQHYAMPMVEAYDLCVSDLINLAGQYNTTYKAVNFVIFIFLFIALLTLNLVVGSFLRVKQHQQ
ncbi:MAG: hypothetical protein J1E63_03415, partial [Muribaculaceae bacterium]|nr:hypothetical protein [Muribaculaceae bacterium]